MSNFIDLIAIQFIPLRLTEQLEGITIYTVQEQGTVWKGHQSMQTKNHSCSTGN